MDYSQTAIPLLVADQRTGKYSITPEAKSVITSIKTPIAVVSVAGMYRTGKSYLLNRMLLNRSSGFGVGPTINPCTKGLWMWGSPIKTRSEDGQPLTLLIIDTEGLGATDEDDNHDNKIFSLAILLSTCFVYNSVGSIDENAIQSLNLVLNLSQTIYQQSSNSKMDTRELPNFYWVVRDFSLQLIDQTGNHITSKEYLENALSIQKGNGKDLEQKNKVRKFIAQCFTVRDCFTMVRPTNADQQLQELDKVPFEQLRPEFVEQVMTLRKRILARLQPKRLNNVVLDGQSYFSVIHTYVQAINSGAVPNIQTAWEYICMERGQKLFNEAEQIFTKGVRDQVQYKIPCLDSEIQGILQSLKKSAVSHFLSNLLGEKSDNLRVELQSRIKQKEQGVYSQNLKQSVSASQGIVTKEYQGINKKLKSGLYNSFSDFEHDIKTFYVFLMEHNRKYQSCEMVYMEFINKRILEGSQFLFKTLEQEVNVLKETKNQMASKGEKETSDLKTELNRVKADSGEYVGRLEREKVESQFRADQMQKQIKQLQVDNQQLLQQQTSRISMLTSEVESLSKQLRDRDCLLENKARQGARSDCLKNAEWEKQKALHLQQQKFYKEKLSSHQRKQKQMEQNLESVKAELDVRVREMNLKSDEKSKALSLELQQKSDKLFQTSNLVKKLQEEIKLLEDSSDSKERKLRAEVLDLQTDLEGYRNDDTVEKNRLRMDNMNEKRQILISLDEERDRVRTLEIQLREVNEQLKHHKASFERDQAIHNQKIQFQDIQLKQLRVKFGDMQATHQNALLNCENLSKEKMVELQNSIVFDLKSSHQRQLKEMECEWESKMRFSKSEVETFKRRKEELELALQLHTKKNEDKEQEYKESIRQLESACQRVQTQKITNQQGTAQFKREIETHYETKIKRLQHELEATKDDSRKELDQAHQQSQITVKELKTYYELEKERLEKKIQDQRQKAESKVRRTIEQQQQKLGEERIQFQEEMATLKSNLSQMQQSYHKKMTNLQFEFDLTLQRVNADLTDRKIQFEKQNALSQQQLEYSNKKIETLNKEKESILMKGDERLRELRAQTQEELRQAMSRVSEQKLVLESKYEKVKVSLRDTEQSLHKLNIDFEKERTVMKSREATLEARLSEMEEKSRLRLKLVEDQLQKVTESFDVEKRNLILEIQRYRMVNSQLEDEKNKMRTTFENEKLLLTNKLKFTQNQGKRYKAECQDVIEKFETTVKHLSKEREVLQNDRTNAVNEIALSLKSQYQREAQTLRNNHNKIVRDLEDRVQRLQAEKKSLNDKVLNLQVRMSSQNSSVDSDRKVQRQIDRVRQDYENRVEEGQSTILDLKRQVIQLEKRLGDTRKQFDDRDISAANKSHLNIGVPLSNKVIPSTNIVPSRESQARKSKLSTIPQGGLSGTSLLGNIGNVSNISGFSGISRKTNKDRLIDLGDFGSPFSTKK